MFLICARSCPRRKEMFVSELYRSLLERVVSSVNNTAWISIVANFSLHRPNTRRS